MHRIALFAVALSACAYEIPGEEPAVSTFGYQIAVARSQWSRVYDIGACDPAGLSVVVADEPTWREMDGDADPSVMGCHVIAPRPTRHVLMIRARHPASYSAQYIVTHEAMHWFAQCSGTYIDDQPEHDDLLIWGRGGILERTHEVLGIR
jgi:hypothetical protein